jgi:hypothetical protein
MKIAIGSLSEINPDKEADPERHFCAGKQLGLMLPSRYGGAVLAGHADCFAAGLAKTRDSVLMSGGRDLKSGNHGGTHHSLQQEYVVGWGGAAASYAIVLSALVFYAGRILSLLSAYAVNVFFSDQWEFNDATLFQKHSLWEMFAWQHGPHRQGLGALFGLLIGSFSGWNSRTESFASGGVLVAAAICALYLKKRLYGSVSPYDVIIPAILLTPGVWETLFVTPNTANGPFPALLLILCCTALTFRNKKIKYPLLLAINFVTIYTGFGIFVGVLTPALLVAEYLTSPAEERLPGSYLAGMLAVCAASFGSYFIGYKFNADLDCFSFEPRSPGYYVRYISFMLANFFVIKGKGILPLTEGFAVLVILLTALATTVWQLSQWRKQGMDPEARTRHLVSALLIAYVILYCAAASYGRLCAALPQSSRYVVYLSVGILGLYFCLLNEPVAVRSKLAMIAFLAPVLAGSLLGDQRSMLFFSSVKREWKECYLRTESLNDCNRLVGFPIFSHPPERTHLQEKLEFLKRQRLNLYLPGR